LKLLALRWLKFNVVGAAGVGIQLACLKALTSGLHLHYLAATALAVEAAVLHNFFWHERCTWKERAGGGRRAIALRLARFHAGNGLISIAGNLLLMGLLVGGAHMSPVLANAIAIAICSLANFAAAEWFVFRRNPAVR
jgi:putative flippase GtrA